MERTTLTERLNRVESEIKAGRPEQALAYCQEVQTAYPRALRVQRVLGEIYLALRRPREALAALDRALAGDPEDVRACCARALVHQIHGDDASALAWYRHACDLRPDDQALRATYRDLASRLSEPPYRPTRAGLARLYLRGDLLAHAIREWEQLVAESPDMLDAQVCLAETLWLAGHERAAEERCRRILANAPSCVKAMLIQMALALAEGDMDAARAHLERTLQLDPDRAIAQSFFADALASGDPVLTGLLRGGSMGNMGSAGSADANDETMKISRPTAGFAQSGPLAGQRNVSRPLVTSGPGADLSFGAPQPPSQPLPPPPRPDVPVPSQPTEVTRAFKETAFMIWGMDDDSQPRITAQHPAQPGQQGVGHDGDPSAPPALRGLSGVLDDAETNRALNWYSWLQAQGAVALGAAAASPGAERPRNTTIPMPADGTAGNIPMNAPAMPSNAASGGADFGSQQGSQGSQQGPRLTMPLPPGQPPIPVPSMPPAPPFGMPPAGTTIPLMPTGAPSDEAEGNSDAETAKLPASDALKTMFAELGGNTGAQPLIVSGTMPPQVSAPGASPESSDAREVNGSGDARGVRDMNGALWPPTAEATAPANAANDLSDTSYAPDIDGSSGSMGDDEGSSSQTIEDLERQFAASGFTPIETRPGLLAEIERGQEPVEPPQQQPQEQREMPAPAVSEPVATGPDPRDYPARLAHARQRRDGGQLDEALNEYRVIIKNAPDLLQEVLTDLRASLDELPDHPNLHSVLGDALVCQGDYEQALEAYNRATELAQARSGRG